MNQPAHHVQHTASRGAAACVGVIWLDSGIAPGLVVDSMRPAITLAAARGLLKQFGAAH